MAQTADTVLAAHVATAVAALTINVNCFNAPMFDAEDAQSNKEAVFLFLDGGEKSEPLHGGQIRHPEVSIRVRGEVDEYESGRDLAQAVWDATQFADLTGFINCELQESAPLYIGKNRSNQHEWSMTAELWEQA